MRTVEEEGKTTAIIAYLTIIGALIAIFMNQEPRNAFARYHTRQAFGIHIVYWALGAIIARFDIWMVQYAYWILFFTLWIYGFLGALQGKWFSIPVLGPYFQKWFTFIR